MSIKAVWITGGTSGIGLAVAEKLLEQGHRVLLTGNEPQAVEALRLTFTDRVD